MQYLVYLSSSENTICDLRNVCDEVEVSSRSTSNINRYLRNITNYNHNKEISSEVKNQINDKEWWGVVECMERYKHS